MLLRNLGMKPSAADREFLPAANAGDPAAFEELTTRHERQVYYLAQRDEKPRLLFVLRNVEGLSVREAAATFGWSEANAKTRLRRARLQLREYLTRTFGDPATRIGRGPHYHE